MKKLYMPILAVVITGTIFAGHAFSENEEEKEAAQHIRVYEEDEIIDRNPERTEKIASPFVLVPYDEEMLNGWNFDEKLWNEFTKHQQALHDIIGTEAERYRTDEFYTLLSKYWESYDAIETDKMKDMNMNPDKPLSASEHKANYETFKGEVEALIEKVESDRDGKAAAKEAVDIIDTYEIYVGWVGGWEATDGIFDARDGFDRGEDKTDELIDSVKWFYGHL